MHASRALDVDDVVAAGTTAAVVHDEVMHNEAVAAATVDDLQESEV
jgi:hypothetical protein